MDKIMYMGITNRLKELVPDIRWIDFDYGQLHADEPEIEFPACLIDISFPNCEDLSYTDPTVQRIDARISLKLAFKSYGKSSMNASQATVLEATSHLDVIAEVHVALQGYSADNLYRLSRMQAIPERSRNSIKTYHVIYKNLVVIRP